MLSDAELSHRLDVALAPMSKVFHHPIPFSDRVKELGASSAPTPRRVSAPSLPPGGELSGSAAEETLRQIAAAEITSRVEGLRQWLDRAAQGRQMGEECLVVLGSLSSCLGSMRDVTAAVQEKGNMLSSNASALMVRKAKLEMVQEELDRMIKHFTRIDVLTREVENPTLLATSARYPCMLQEMEEEMQFLSRNSQFLSSKTYATRLALAQQRAFQCLKDAIVTSVQSAQAATVDSEVYKKAFYEKKPRRGSNDIKNVENSSTTSTAAAAAVTTTTLISAVAVADENSFDQKAISEVLEGINAIFCDKLREKESLRRMMEMRGGEDGDMGNDANDNEILNVYRDSRVFILGPLLQNWLETWYEMDKSLQRMPKLVNYLTSLMKVTLMCEKEVFESVWLREDFAARVFPQLATDLSSEVYHVFRSELLQVDDLEELAETIEVIQWENTRQGDVAELNGLLTKLIQDTQERLIFRTSVFLRHSIMRSCATKEKLQEFLNDGISTSDSYIPALSNCVALLRILYPSLEFSVFSVFAEEAIHCTLTQVQELAKVMSQQRGEHSAIKGLMCQLCHLLHLREELSRIDENITVVEKRIDLSKIAQRRLEIVQSSRESKKDVETEIKVCCERLVQELFSEISSPLSGIARKKGEEIRVAVTSLEHKWTEQKDLLALYISNASTREVLLRPLRARLGELLREVDSIQRQQPQQLGDVVQPMNEEGRGKEMVKSTSASGIVETLQQGEKQTSTVPETAAAAPPPSTFSLKRDSSLI